VNRTPADEPQRGFNLVSRRRGVGDEQLDAREEYFFGEDFAVRGRRAAALEGLVSDLRRRGIRVLLVAPPLHPELHARVRREVSTFRSAMQKLADEHDAVFEDLTLPERSGLTQRNFVDDVHINEEGTTRFSRRIGQVIRSRFGAG
jgi:lysophospholipase L1-like esterase